jgi:hypothetical protein
MANSIFNKIINDLIIIVIPLENLCYDGGPPAPTGPALPNLINEVSMFKVKVKNRVSVDFDFDFDFNILTAFIRLGRAGPRRGPGALHIIII